MQYGFLLILAKLRLNEESFRVKRFNDELSYLFNITNLT